MLSYVLQSKMFSRSRHVKFNMFSYQPLPIHLGCFAPQMRGVITGFLLDGI